MKNKTFFPLSACLLFLFTMTAPLPAWEVPQPTMILTGDQEAGGLKFNNPTAVAFGRDGDIFVTDTLNAVVQVFDRNGKFKFYLGEPGMKGGQFTIPWGIATDKDGKVYVSDIAQHRIQIFNHNGLFLGQFGGPGKGEGKFNLPFDLFIDKWDQLNILDSGNGLIQRIKEGFDRQFGGIGISDGSFDSPAAFIGDDSGRYYVVDTGNKRIQTISSDGKFLGKFGMAGSADGSFVNPAGIAMDAAGRLYISDGDKTTVGISVFETNGEFLYKWGEIGTEPGYFLDPGRIAFDKEQRFYVVDTGNNRVQVFTDLEYKTAPCFFCHTKVAGKSEAEFVHEPFKRKNCQACHLSHNSASANFYPGVGAELCRDCHDFKDEEFYQAHQLYPVDKTGCVECHDPHGSNNAHLVRYHSAAPKGKDVACAQCHDVLVDDTVRLKEDRRKLCYICHNTKLGDSHYQVFQKEQLDCLECHVRHSGSVPANLKSFDGAICSTADCHSSKNLLHQHESDIYPRENMAVPGTLPLDKKGKITCLTCHSGHATPNAQLLRVAKENLCLLCHQKRTHKKVPLEVREVIQRPTPPVKDFGAAASGAPESESPVPGARFVPGNEP